MADSTKLLVILVQRVAEKLPVNSNTSIDALETDAVVVQTAQSLIELSQYRLKEVAGALASLLDAVSKGSGNPGDDSSIREELLHSQLYVLRLLANCLAYSWRCYRQGLATGSDLYQVNKAIFPDSPTLNRISIMTSPNGPPQTSPAPGGSASASYDDQFPPLDDQLAKYILNVISRFFHTSSSNINTDVISHQVGPGPGWSLMDVGLTDLPSSGVASAIGSKGATSALRGSLSMSSLSSLATTGAAGLSASMTGLYNNGQVAIPLAITRESPPLSPSNGNGTLASSEVGREVQKAAGRVLFYISAANWPTVFARIKGRFSTFGQNAAEYDGDLTETKMLEWCSLNRVRLGQVLQEFTTFAPKFQKRTVHYALIVLRRVIWNWIETFPLELVALFHAQKKMEGGPDVLFDTLYTISEGSKRKAVFWPTLTMLLILCPDILYNVGMQGAAANSSKSLKSNPAQSALLNKAAFLETMKKSLKSRGAGDAAALCYVDICRASTYVSKQVGSALRMIVPNIEHELKDKLFDPAMPVLPPGPPGASGDNVVDQKLMIECLSALFKLNPWTTLRNLVPVMLDPAAPMSFKMVVVKSCYSIVSETSLPWNPKIDASLAKPLRELFLEAIGKTGPADPKNKRLASFISSQTEKKAKRAIEGTQEKNDIIYYILRTWCKCPLLAIAADHMIIPHEVLRVLLSGIASCTIDQASCIRRKAAEAILHIFDPEFIPQWDGSRPDWRAPLDHGESVDSLKPLRRFWKTSCQSLLSLGKLVLDVKGEVDRPSMSADLVAPGVATGTTASLTSIRYLLELIRELLRRRNEHLRRFPSSALSIARNIQDRLTASAALEVAFLVFICSSESDISECAVQCLGYMLEEATITGEALTARAGWSVPDFSESQLGTVHDDDSVSNDPLRHAAGTAPSSGTGPLLTVVENMSMYREMVGLLHSNGRGRREMQQQIWTCLRGFDRPTPGQMGAWEEVYKRWRALSQLITTKSHAASVNADIDKESVTGSRSNFTSRAPAPRPSFQTSAEYSEDRGEWQNYTGFLCALGGCSLLVGDLTNFPASPSNNINSLYKHPQSSSSLASLSTVATGSSIGGDASFVETGGALSPNAVTQLMGAYINSKQTVNRFVAEMVELLTTDNDVVREVVTEFLGGEMAPGLYGILFTHLETAAYRFFDATTGEALCTERHTLLVGSMISVLRIILDRAEELADRGDPLAAVDFGGLLLQITLYLSRLGVLPGQQIASIKGKIRVCQLVETLIENKQIVGLRQEIRLRNRLVELILEWNSEFSFVGRENLLDIVTGNTSDESAFKNDRLPWALDLDAMKAMVALLSGLPLQPASNDALVSIPNSETNADVKARLFYKYFSFFLKVLQKCKLLENLETTHAVPGTTLTPNLQHLLARSKETTEYLGPLKDYTILALSNLLSANIDIGLKFSLSMGYHEDSKTRAAFIQVLTNVLSMGAADQFEGLGTEERGQSERYDRLMDLMLEPGLEIVKALCEVAPVSESDEIAQVLLSLVDARGQSLRLLATVIDVEVAKTDTPANLFRRNSLSTRMLTIYGRLNGQDYLHLTLEPVLKELMSRHPPPSFEVDPNRLAPNDDLNRNLKNLISVSQAFLNAILSSGYKFPRALKEVCMHIAKVVSERFPEAKIMAVGGFVFLRFLCPAIVSPEGADLVPPIQSKELRRGLVLVTKVIQNLANNVLFGAKESYMVPLNELLKENVGLVNSFLKDIATSSGAPMSELPPTASTGRLHENDVYRLHRHLVLNQDRLEKLAATVRTDLPVGSPQKVASLPSGHARKLAVNPAESIPSMSGAGALNAIEALAGGGDVSVGAADVAASDRKRAFGALLTLLTQLGPPVEVSRVESNDITTLARRRSAMGASLRPAVISSQLMSEFMARVESRSGFAKAIEHMREMRFFYDAGVSKERRCVVYYIAQKVAPVTMDMELLVYFILKTLKPYILSLFEIVIDATQFSAENEWSPEWIARLEKLIPYEAYASLAGLFIYNANMALRKFAKKFPKYHSKLGKRVFFFSSLSEFNDHIGDLRLPKSTVALEKEVIATFSPVNKVTSYRQQMPVAIKVNQDTIQITTVKKQEFLGYSAILNDVFPVSDIESVGSSPNKADDYEFIFKIVERVGLFGEGAIGASNSAVSVITFSSPKRDLILQSVRAAIARFQLSKPTNIIADQRTLRPSDVPGTLLNMALLSIGSEDPNLRLASYNLLCALSMSFSFDAGNQLLSARGLCIPANNHGFVISISQKLAATEQHLTLEFLTECGLGFAKSNKELKHHCLEYMAPWLANLGAFSRAGTLQVAEGSVEEAYSEQLSKLRDVLKSLIDITVKEREMDPLVQATIWTALGRVDEFIPIVLDSFIQTAVESGLGSTQTEVLANTTVTLASVNVNMVAGKMISRLRRVLAATSQAPAASLVDHPSWNEVAVLLRFMLMLSFNNRLNVQHYAAELAHIVCLVFGLGSLGTRASLRGTVVNIVQSICTSMELDDASLGTLQIILNEMSEHGGAALFGVCGLSTGQASDATKWNGLNSNTAFVHSPDAYSGDVARDVPLFIVEAVVNLMLDVLTYGTIDAEQSATWKARWMSLIASTAFQYNPAVQPRAFVALGCLARDDVDDDLLHQILVALRGALTLFEDNECQLTVSIIMALCNIVGGLTDDSRYLRTIFWLAIALLQIGHVPIFQSALLLLQVCLRTMENQGLFEEEGISTPLMQARDAIAEAAHQLDAAVGIYFRDDFPFSVAATLLKGLRHPSTRSATTQVLLTFLKIAARNPTDMRRGTDGIISRIGPDRLGYLIPLMPFTANIKDLLAIAGRTHSEAYSSSDSLYLHNVPMLNNIASFDPKDTPSLNSAVTTAPVHLVSSASPAITRATGQSTRVLEHLAVTDNSSLPLAVSILVTMLDNAEYESETLFIYGFIAEAAQAVPEVFALLYESLYAKMMQVLTTSQSLPLIEAVHSILKAVVAIPPHKQPPHITASSPASFSSTPTSQQRKGNQQAGLVFSSQASQLLNQLGFPGLAECGSFAVEVLVNLHCGGIRLLPQGKAVHPIREEIMAHLPPPAFGSPSAHARNAPNLVFLIDSSQLSSTANLVRFLVLKTLLFFYLRVDSRLSWAFQIYDQNAGTYVPAFNLKAKSSQQDLQNLRPSALLKLAAAIQASMSNSRVNSNDDTPAPPLENMVAVLKKALVDFGWSFVPHAGFFQSPARPAGERVLSQNTPIRIRNYLFVVAPAPKNDVELREFVEGSNAVDASSSDKMQSVDIHLDTIQDALLGKGLLDGYLDKRTAINWIDTQWLKPESLNCQVTPYIHHSLCSILRAYGGSLIPAHALMNDASIVHFSTAFSIYRPKTADPSIGISLLEGSPSPSVARLEVMSKLCEQLVSFQLIAMTVDQSTHARIKHPSSSTDTSYTNSPFQEICSSAETTFDPSPTMKSKGDVSLCCIDKTWMESVTYLVIPSKKRGRNISDGFYRLFQLQLLARRGVVVQFLYGIKNEFESRLGILSGLSLGVGCLRVIKKEYVNSLTTVASSDSKEDIDWDVVNSWYQEELDFDLMSFFFGCSGPLEESLDINKLLKASLGVWDAESKLNIGETSVLNDPAKALTERADCEDEDSNEQVQKKSYSFVEEALKDLRRYCVMALYDSEKMPLLTLLGADGLYRPMQYVHEHTEEPQEPFELIFQQFASVLLMPLPKFDEKYRTFSKVFESSLADGCKQLKAEGLIDELEAQALLPWMNKWEMSQIEAATRRNSVDGVGDGIGKLLDHKSIIRNAVKELRMIEAQLQIVLILELLRLSLFTKVPLPPMSLLASSVSITAEAQTNGNGTPSKKRKCVDASVSVTPTKRRRSSKGRKDAISTGVGSSVSHLSQVAEEWMDRLCIWGSIAGVEESADNTTGVAGFAAGILKMMYHAQLPELINSLLVKSGAATDVTQPSPAPPELFSPPKLKMLPSKLSKQVLTSDRQGNRSSGSGHSTSRISERSNGADRGSTRLSSSATTTCIRPSDEKAHDGASGGGGPKRRYEAKLLQIKQRQIVLPKVPVRPKSAGSAGSSTRGGKRSKDLSTISKQAVKKGTEISKDVGKLGGERTDDMDTGARIETRDKCHLFSPRRSSATRRKLPKTPTAAIGARLVPENPFLDANRTRRGMPSPPKAPVFFTPLASMRVVGGLGGNSGLSANNGSKVNATQSAGMLAPPTPVKDCELFTERDIIEDTPVKKTKYM
ncbi:hypothetical protein SeLEV6574_g01999 [Synchytrium endobioticum]|uniref:Ras-GAP domain-containing protein n=1 Tax=Synchytrium endobioticum TaxID=286115 RepID=A0A507DAC1_9FUNG|nr:hypothetical protein SeLEV6574_g01999 [Synchytrium endobioticum]